MNFARLNSHKLLLGIRDIVILKFHSLYISFLDTFNQIFYKFFTVKWITYTSTIQKKNQVTEAADRSVNFSANQPLQLFKPNILNATEIIRDKKKKRYDIDAMKTKELYQIYQYSLQTRKLNKQLLFQILFKNHSQS